MQRDDLTVDRLLELLKEQQDCYRRLCLLSEKQKALVAGDEAESLLTLLGQRQRLVDELVGRSAELSPYRRRWSEFYAGLDGASRKLVSELLEDLNGSLGLILREDRRDSATLTAKRNMVAGTLAACDAGRRASSAYSQSVPASVPSQSLPSRHFGATA